MCDTIEQKKKGLVKCSMTCCQSLELDFCPDSCQKCPINELSVSLYDIMFTATESNEHGPHQK